ncbi:30S ribosomal protein S3 [bacterium]|nr:30S ribosomal protein S3 [bacterium]
MGQKVNPNAFRLGISKKWSSKWFATKDKYVDLLKKDHSVRRYLEKKLNKHFVDNVEIEIEKKKMNIIVFTARPGIVIGKSGEGVDLLKKDIEKIVNDKNIVINLTVKEVTHSDLSASIILEQAISEIERRMPFKKVMKKMIDKVKQAGAKGAKISMSGRLNGVDIARSETLIHGSIPLHTIRADVDYANGHASTIYGSIGIKVWIYKGLIFDKKKKTENNKSKRNN